jgi:hypothetical protein
MVQLTSLTDRDLRILESSGAAPSLSVISRPRLARTAYINLPRCPPFHGFLAQQILSLPGVTTIMPASDDGPLLTVGIADTTQFTDLALHNSNLTNLRLSPTGSEEPLYFVNNSPLRPNTPDITLHNGADDSAPIIGVARLTLSGANTIGIGDFSQADTDGAMVWETLQRTSRWSHATYQYESSFGGGPESRIKFEWRRLNRTFAGSYCLQLVDLSNSNTVLGAFITGHGMRIKTRGRLLIQKGHGQHWERMALLTGLSYIELMRRRRRRRRIQ